MFDPLLMCVLGVMMFGISILYDKYVKYVDSRSPRMVETREMINTKIQNNEKLTKTQLFHFYAYSIWNVIIKIGIYGGVMFFLIGCLISLLNK